MKDILLKGVALSFILIVLRFVAQHLYMIRHYGENKYFRHDLFISIFEMCLVLALAMYVLLK